MRNLIIRLNEQRGITVVVSSHVLDQLGRIACLLYTSRCV